MGTIRNEPFALQTEQPFAAICHSGEWQGGGLRELMMVELSYISI